MTGLAGMRFGAPAGPSQFPESDPPVFPQVREETVGIAKISDNFTGR